MKIKLKTPINEGKITEIELTEPTLGMLARCGGLPFSEAGIDFAKAIDLLEATTGIQAPFLREMKGKDSIKVIGELAKMLGDEEETKN